MASAIDILEGQVIYVKRGRFNQFGFEPAWNAYFDFYLSSKYLETPLLQLEDVTFHLFLRKNLNDRNPEWKMPSIRQMKRRLSIGQRKLEAIMVRLDQAHLLKKVSGLHKGEYLANIANHYILSDPIQTLEEFLTVADSGAFGFPLKEPLYAKWVQGVPDLHTAPIREMGTDKQTYSFEQTVWKEVLKHLQGQLVANTFFSFVEGTQLVGIEDGVATVFTDKTYALDWLNSQLHKRFRDLLNLELRLRGDVRKVEQIKIQTVSFEGAGKCFFSR